MWMILIGIGALILIAGAIMFLVAAFKEHILWGLGCLFIGPVELIFLILHWEKASKPFVIEVVGIALIAAGIQFGPPDIRNAAYAAMGFAGDKPAAEAAKAPQAAPLPVAPAPVVAAPPPPKPPPPDTRSRSQRISDDCASELGMLCNEARGEKAQLACLDDNENGLTDACRKAISRN